MNLLQVADNLVCRKRLLSLVGVNDLLRLRRVCTQFKAHADDFIRTQKVVTQRVIDFDSFCQDENPLFNFENKCSNLPIRTRAEFWKIPASLEASLQNCLKTLATNITHFRIYWLDFLHSNHHVKFFELLPNLEHLEMDFCGGTFGAVVVSEKDIHFPTPFPNLKTLKIRQCNSNALPYIIKLVDACIPNLERISLPFHEFLREEEENNMDLYWTRLASKCLYSPASKLKLEGVFGCVIDELLRGDNRTPEMGTCSAMWEAINVKVVSIIHPEILSFLLELPNLEEIVFASFTNFMVPHSRLFVRRKWGKLKSVRIITAANADMSFRQLWKFLFVGIVRESVEKLDIDYYHNEYEKYNFREEIFFNGLDIPSSCPNLKILNLRGCLPALLNLADFWRELPLLESLLIECGHLRDGVFIGSDPQCPSFWSLKKLKVLELRMETTSDLLTDKLFSQVLCHMPLQELCLRSYEGAHLKSITLDGIRSLLKGQFATTVERLSVKHLDLPGVTQEEKAKVESLFRSSQRM